MTTASVDSDFNLEGNALPPIGQDNARKFESLSPSPTSVGSSASVLESDRESDVAPYWRSAEQSSAQESLLQASLHAKLDVGTPPSSPLASYLPCEEGQETIKSEVPNCIDCRYRVSSPSAPIPVLASNDANDPCADVEILEFLAIHDDDDPKRSEGPCSPPFVACNNSELERKGKGKPRYLDDCTSTSLDGGSSTDRNDGPAEDKSLIGDNNKDGNEHSADLAASTLTIRPTTQRPPTRVADQEGDSNTLASPPSHASASASPHSDRSYTFEIRPPSTRFYLERPTVQTPAFLPSSAGSYFPPPSRSLLPTSTFSPGLTTQVLDGRSLGMRHTGSQGQQIAEPAMPTPSRPTMTMEGRNENEGSSQPKGNPIRPMGYRQSYHQLTSESSRHELLQSSMSTPYVDHQGFEFYSPQMSPLDWYPSQRSTPPSEPFITPMQTGRPVRSTGPSDNPPWFPYGSPARMRPSPVVQRDDSLPQFGTTLSESPAPTPSVASNPPSAPERLRRFNAPLPPSPGSSLRSSAFNSPYMHAADAASADSWGTAVDPNFTQATPSQNASTPRSEPPLPPMPTSANRVPLSPWLHDSPPWTDSDSSPWGRTPNSSDQGHMHTPQFGSIPHPRAYAPPAGYVLLCRSCGSPSGACGCRRHSEMPPSAVGSSCFNASGTGRLSAMPHPTFWFPDGTITFQVEDRLFKVHQHFFERHSNHFRSIFAMRIGALSIPPFRIADVRRLDFERLLMVFYPSNYLSPDLTTVEEWTSVLTLTVKWQMDDVISLAIHKLTPITSAVDKISLAKKFGLFGYNLMPNNNHNRDWLLPALKELCTRNLPLRMEEARKLDRWTVIKVWEVQFEILHLGVVGHNDSRIERLIKRRFGLE